MFLIALLLLAAPQAPMPQPASSPAAPPEKKICRREVMLGSAMSKKVCYTPAELKQQMRESVGRSDSARGTGGRCAGPAC